MIYLASPYFHPDPSIREKRFRDVCHVAAHFMRKGIYIFCPIAHTHPIVESGDLPKGWDYWQEYDRQMLSVCSELWIVQLDGWKESVGIKGEIQIAREMGLSIKYVRYYPNDIITDIALCDNEEL